MSEGEGGAKAPGAGAKAQATKRRRRRRRPGRDGESDRPKPDAEARSSSGGDSSPGGSEGPGRSKRRRGRGKNERGKNEGRKNEGSDKRPGKGADGGKGGTSQASRSQTSRSPSRSPSRSQASRSQPSQASASKIRRGKPRFEAPEADESVASKAESAASSQPTVRWGDDSAAPTPEIKLAADMPPNPPSTDLDPTSASLLESEGGYDGQLSARICNVIGVRFASAGRIYLYDAGDGHYAKGETVVVEGERGQRSATVTTASCRRPPPRSLKRIIRRGSLAQPGEQAAKDEELQRHLSTAKAKAKELRLGIKVFRAAFEEGGKALGIYYSCEDKTDVRPLTRALSDALPMRFELRHTGVRDEAKLVGGIGACGQELCCTTWLPSFVPVSIKHAKDQGLALTPNKISGQCGRLKCCLVYEQENYARLRKGLPKLGKRVITNDGFEGRVIELDVLHGRIRVSVGRGESKVYKKGEVEPMFASQQQGQGQGGGSGKSKKDTRTPTPEDEQPKQEEASNDDE